MANIFAQLFAKLFGHTDTVKPRTFVCHNEAELYSAALFAASHPGTTILGVAGVQYNITRDVFAKLGQLTFRGTDVTIDGRGAILSIQHHNEGPNGVGSGVGVFITPVLADPVPFAKQIGGFWCNPRGRYSEEAPIEHAAKGVKPNAVFTLFRKEIVPVKNIVFKNWIIRCDDPQTDRALDIHYGVAVRLENIKVVPPAGSGLGAIMVVGSEACSLVNCDAPNIPLNSCTNVVVQGCAAEGVAMEEVCRECTVRDGHFRNVLVQDDSCTDITILRNTLHDVVPGKGSMNLLGTRMIIQENWCDDLIGIQGAASGVKLIKNIGKAWRDWRVTMPGRVNDTVIDQGNRWTEQ